ncbi:MAG: NADPH:quinone oxidoreductase family protein [Rhodospirillales bacterium]
MAIKAWRSKGWGEPHSMALETIEAPEPGPGEALVRVNYAALNFFDALMIAGKYQVKPAHPYTPGCEMSGEVIAVGEGVQLALGSRVCGQPNWGAFAEACIMPAAQLHPIPEGVDMRAAACVPVVYPTAHIALRRRGNLQSGETLLVTAAAGGVGIAAVQLGKAWGARVIALAGGEKKCSVARENGADHTFDYLSDLNWVEAIRDLTNGTGVDVIFDPVGGEIFNDALKVLAFEGRAVIIGFAGGEIQKIAANRLLLKNASAVGAIWGGYRLRDTAFASEVVADCFEMMAESLIKPAISDIYSLEEVPEALKSLDSRQTWGKVLVKVQGP